MSFYTDLKLDDATLFLRLLPPRLNDAEAPLLLPRLAPLLFAGAPIIDEAPGIELAIATTDGGLPPNDNIVAIRPPIITADSMIKGA